MNDMFEIRYSGVDRRGEHRTARTRLADKGDVMAFAQARQKEGWKSMSIEDGETGRVIGGIHGVTSDEYVPHPWAAQL
jgi:hypothetical protein